MDGGEAIVADPGEASLLRARAVRIYVESFVGAALLTGLSLLAVVWLMR